MAIELHDDLCDQGERCCPNRVARLAKSAGIKAQIGYKRRPGQYSGKPSLIVDNTRDRQVDVDAPDRFWVTDITYMKTMEHFKITQDSPKKWREVGSQVKNLDL